MVTTKIPIHKIIKDKKIMPRNQIYQEYVDDLVEDLEGKAKFPPVDLFRDGKRNLLADGYHRLEATIKAGHKTIEAVVHRGDKRDALLFSSQANVNHGKRRTNEDKRKAVFKLLMDPEWSQWSDGKIAKRCAVSQPFVSNLRQELTQNGFESPARRKGADGRTIDTEKIGKNRTNSKGQRAIETCLNEEQEHQKNLDKSEMPTGNNQGVGNDTVGVSITVNKDDLPPKANANRKGINEDDKKDKDDSDIDIPTPDLSITLAEAKNLIIDLEGCLRDFKKLLPAENKIKKLNEIDVSDHWKRLRHSWKNLVICLAKTFDLT